MPTTQAEFRTRLEVLVNRFKTNAAEYLSTEYSEAQARHQFIDPRCDFVKCPCPAHANPA